MCVHFIKIALYPTKESGLCGKDVVVGAEAGHYSVHWGQAGVAGRDEAAYLRHDDCDAGHTEDGGFTGCVGIIEEVEGQCL